MKTTKFYSFIILLCCSFAGSALAGKFESNYKNLNALAFIVCENYTQKILKPQSTVYHKFEVAVIETGKSSSKNYEITGRCAQQLSNDSQLDGGEDLRILLSHNKNITGEIGLYNLFISSSNNNIESIVFTSKFDSNDKLVTKLGINQSWSSTSFLNSSKLKISAENSLFQETNDSISFSYKAMTKSKLFNHWSYQSVACSLRNNNLGSNCSSKTMSRLL